MSTISSGELHIDHVEVDSLGTSLNSAVGLTTAQINWGQAPTVLLIIENISTRKTSERALARANEQLRAVNRVTRHDTRNEMTVIARWSGELSPHFNDDGQAMPNRIQKTAPSVIYLTTTVRNFIEALGTDQRPELGLTAVYNILDAEGAKCRSMRPRATFQVDDEFPDISVQANNLLSSVFRNILNNTVQHNHNDNPVIEFGCRATDDTIRISVANNGSGIPDGQEDSVFG